MTPLLVLLATGSFFTWLYYSREFAVRARPFLLLARLVAVSALIAILWNPDLNSGSARDLPSEYVILDRSTSMSARSEAGESLWELAVARARSLTEGGTRLLLADQLADTPADSHDLDRLAASSPTGSESLLARSVGLATEAGARSIVLVTDRRIADPVATREIARQLGVSLTVDSLPETGPNIGISRLVVPATAESGDQIRGRVELGGSSVRAGGAAAERSPDAMTGDATNGSSDAESDGISLDTITVSILVDGREGPSLRVPAPTGGGLTSAPFSLGPLSAGALHITARLEHQDAFPLDNERSATVHVDPEETGILLVSFVADWEPRFLFPVLNQVTGLPVRGYVRAGSDRFMQMTTGNSARTTETSTNNREINLTTLTRLLTQAELVVAMGVDASNQELLTQATRHSRALLLFPMDAAGAAVAGVATHGPQPGEWLLAGLPPSAIAGQAGQFQTGVLPPLTSLLRLADEPAGVAMEVRQGTGGTPQPALVLRQDGDSRFAVALGRGFWRWAFRDGVPRDQYRRLWAAVAGWLMQSQTETSSRTGLRPAASILPRDIPIRWLAFGREGHEAQIMLTNSAGAVVLDTVYPVPASGRFTTTALPPGRYDYTAVTVAPLDSASPARATTTPDTTSGTFHVDPFSDEMLHRAVAPASLTVPADPQGASLARTRPLRSSPIPYLVLLVALCAEWIGRRRAGLR